MELYIINIGVHVNFSKKCIIISLYWYTASIRYHLKVIDVRIITSTTMTHVSYFSSEVPQRMTLNDMNMVKFSSQIKKSAKYRKQDSSGIAKNTQSTSRRYVYNHMMIWLISDGCTEKDIGIIKAFVLRHSVCWKHLSLIFPAGTDGDEQLIRGTVK